MLALDQGTTSSRAVLYDRTGAIRSVGQREFTQIYPRAGWVEHDPEEIWASQMSVAVEALSLANARPRDVAALGITNQRETTIVWERKTGKPVYNAIVWQDRRTAPVCDQLREQGREADDPAENRFAASTPTFPPPRSCGFSTTLRGRAPRPMPANWLLEPSIAG